MKKESKIYVAGYKGLVGSAIRRKLQKKGYTNLLLSDIDDFNLQQQTEVNAFFEREQPEYVFLAAAKVGGIWANKTYPAEFIYSNLSIEVNVTMLPINMVLKNYYSWAVHVYIPGKPHSQ